MVNLTKAQKKKLKIHAVNQSARHIKTMIALMKNGESFREAHNQASKQSQKQKQKQSQSQKVVINLQTPKKRTTKPRASTRPSSARVLSQFIQPAQVIPDYRTMINPAPIPMPFMQPIQTPQLNNIAAPRPISSEGRVLGRGYPLETPIEVKNVLKAINDADILLSGKKEQDDTSTQGRTLLPDRMWSGNARSDVGISSLSDTEQTDATRGLRRASDQLRPVDEATSDEEGFGGGSGIPSPSLIRQY